MHQQFQKNIEEKKLFSAGQKILLAVSGGIDSMVMLHLFEKSGFDFGVAHCNFQLRGAESDEDEKFVKNQVLNHGIPAFFIRFETEEYAEISGISIEMAARELRYQWFEKIRSENVFDMVATAHHSDDQIETFFLNLTRKTGIKGLTGIKEKSGKIIRPMLFASRAEIEKFAHANYIDYREDSSNAETVFQRNFIRNKIIPAFEKMNPAFRKNMTESIENLKEAEVVYSGYFLSEKQKVVENTRDSLVIKIGELKKSAHPKLLLLEILSEYNFNSEIVEQVFQGIGGESGKQYYSKTHRLLKDRDNLFITGIGEPVQQLYYIERDDLEITQPLHLMISKQQVKDFTISKEPHIACLNAGKLEFPLLIRKWQPGDYFQPFGMTGFKKVSDFFIDEKVPVHQKENTWLLCSGEKIVWIIGYRTDNRFRIDKHTRNVLKIKIAKENQEN